MNCGQPHKGTYRTLNGRRQIDFVPNRGLVPRWGWWVGRESVITRKIGTKSELILCISEAFYLYLRKELTARKKSIARGGGGLRSRYTSL